MQLVMQYYIGVKNVSAKPLSLGEYNKLRGWKLPHNENPETAGYLVQYHGSQEPNVKGFDGYVSWCPKEQFESANKRVGPDESDYLTFELALMMLKDGHRLAREGWNGHRQWVVLVRPGYYDVGCSVGAKAGSLQPFLALKNAQDKFQPGWVPSMGDMLADDWYVVCY